jgi:hypothetical protein
MDQIRLDRALATDFKSGLETMSVEDLRAKKAECTELETVTSYLRRMAQGRLDIVADEQRRRRTGEGPIQAADLVESLTDILAGGSRQPGPGRLPATMAPDEAEADTAELDHIAGAAALGDLSNLDDATLATLVDDLSAYEAGVSRLRQSLFERIDRLQAELVRRYKTGEAKVESLLR